MASRRARRLGTAARVRSGDSASPRRLPSARSGPRGPVKLGAFPVTFARFASRPCRPMRSRSCPVEAGRAHRASSFARSADLAERAPEERARRRSPTSAIDSSYEHPSDRSTLEHRALARPTRRPGSTPKRRGRSDERTPAIAGGRASRRNALDGACPASAEPRARCRFGSGAPHFAARSCVAFSTAHRAVGQPLAPCSPRALPRSPGLPRGSGPFPPPSRQRRRLPRPEDAFPRQVLRAAVRRSRAGHRKEPATGLAVSPPPSRLPALVRCPDALAQSS